MTAEEIARVCHEANRAMTFLVADAPVQPPWDEADADTKAGKLRAVQFVIDNPKATPEQIHTAWCDERWRQGWIWGPVKDLTAKLHPSLRPYKELSVGTRQKDAVFQAIIQALR